MHDADLLLTTAQIGMALAGFAGLVTLLGHANVSGNARLNEVGFRSMMELSVTLAIFALLPLVPHGLCVQPLGAYRIASAIYAAGVVTFLVRSARRNRALIGRVLIQGGVSARSRRSRHPMRRRGTRLEIRERRERFPPIAR